MRGRGKKKSNIQCKCSECEMSPMMIIHQNYTISLCVRRYKKSVCLFDADDTGEGIGYKRARCTFVRILYIEFS